ncbi:MAG: response regulator transcription factor [Burkholderiaceae bacterium]|nr:response regulator transcription factor [Burkholderiaceae bacterium]
MLQSIATTGVKTTAGSANQSSQGQFSYHANPDSLWPDFLMGQDSHPLRVLLIDSDARMRSVIGQELNADTRMSLVSTASNLSEGKHSICRFEFDVLLLDFNLVDGIGLELIKYMKMHRPNAEVIVMSVSDSEENALRAFELGATGYLVKNSWFGNFSQAVLQVANGGAFISPNLARRLLHKLSTVHHTELHAYSAKGLGLQGVQGASHLSLREKEILELVASGHTNPTIATRIGISIQTVTTHMKNIYRKLQVHTRAQAVMQAKNQGLLNDMNRF